MSRQRKSNKVKLSSKEEKDESPATSVDESEHGQTKIMWRKVIGRLLLSAFMIAAAYWTTSQDTEKIFVAQKDTVKHRTQEVPCSKTYQKEISQYKGCIPRKCGRLVTDIIVSETEAAHLLQIAKKGLAFGGSAGGVSILDLHSGALSQGSAFVNVYKKLKELGKTNVFTDQDFLVYKNVRHKIQQMIAFNFGLEVNKLKLTYPTFFSEMTARGAKTKHDEYWHIHVDKETYQSFHYTSLLYLSDYSVDFTGGRFYFVEKSQNVTVEPKLGRVSAFTSGAENPHFVERVSSGTRYALTVSFTCDKNSAIGDPSVENMS